MRIEAIALVELIC